ncbi:MAG TPA: alpha/beta hydrolase [Tepidisphaeraceae bacterium]|nr:alpha/beta hydrolase [Tepidisphaeraceae bacterium]
MHPGLLILVLVLVGVGLLLAGVTIALMAWSLLHPPRMTDGKALWVLKRLSPADIGLAFEDLRFDVRDERGRPLRLAAWWIPHPNADGRCAVLIHGYADAKVGAIAWAPMWHAMGFNLLVPDLRAHGESEGSVCTAGYFERDDLSQILDELRESRPQDTREFVLFGVSMGAAVACATAANRTDVQAVVIDSPYVDFTIAAMAHMDRLGLPGRILQRPAIELAQWLTNANFDAVRTVGIMAKLPCPLLVIESENDSFISPADRARLAQAVEAHNPEHGPAELWTVPGAEHLAALSSDSAAYQERLKRFLTPLSVVTRR